MNEELADLGGYDPAAWNGLTVHQRMIRIVGELPAIGKNRRNEQQGFMFRGVDDVLDALNPLLSKWGVFYVPYVLERTEAARQTSRGGTLYVVNLHVQYTFYGWNGDSIIASGWGEGTDSGDKATNKAMTGAMKYVLFQAFAISTDDAQDSDSTTQEPSRPTQTPQQAKEARKKEWGDQPLPEGWSSYDEFDDAHQIFTAGMGTLTPENVQKMKEFRKENGIGWPMDRAQYDACIAHAESLKPEAEQFAEA